MNTLKRVRVTTKKEVYETSISSAATKESIISYFGNLDGILKVEELQPNYGFSIFDGYDHFNKHELFRVVGKDNEYAGEWHKSKFDAIDELKELIAKSDVLLWEYDFEKEVA